MRTPLLLAATLLAFVPIGCGDGGNDPRITATAPIALRYQVDGMHCDGCVQAITDKVKHVDGVVDCRVSLADRQADVVVRDDTTASAKTLSLISPASSNLSSSGRAISSGISRRTKISASCCFDLMLRFSW